MIGWLLWPVHCVASVVGEKRLVGEWVVVGLASMAG